MALRKVSVAVLSGSALVACMAMPARGAAIGLTSSGYTQTFSTFATDNAGTAPVSASNTGAASAIVLPAGFTIGGVITSGPANGGNGGYGADTSSSAEDFRGVYADGGPGGTKGSSSATPPYQTDSSHGSVYAGTTYTAGVTTAGGGSYAIIDRGSGTNTLELNFAVTNTTGSTLTGLQIGYQVEQFSGAGTTATTVALYSDSGAGTAGNSTATNTLNGFTQNHLTGTVSQTAGEHFTDNGGAFNTTTGAGFDVSADATTAVTDANGVIEPFGATTANGYTTNAPSPGPSTSGPEIATVSALYSNSVAAGQTVNFTLYYTPSTAAGTSGERGFIGVSNLSLTPVGLATVPEPASLGILGLGAIGLFGRRRSVRCSAAV